MFSSVHEAMNEYVVERDGFDGVVHVVHRPDRADTLVLIRCDPAHILAGAFLTFHTKVIANANIPTIHDCHNGKS